MSAEGGKNVGNLSLVRGGQYAAPMCSAEIAWEREVRERMAALRGADGRSVRDRTVYNIAEGVTHPTRVIARLVRRLKAKRVPFDQAHNALVEPLDRHLRRVYGKTATGEHRPAA